MNKVGYKIVYRLQFHFVKKKKSEKKERRRKRMGVVEKEKEGGMEGRAEGEKDGLPVHADPGPGAELL